MTTIGVIGFSQREGVELPAATLTAAEEVGRRIAESGAVLVGGGTGGVMAASCRGAKLAGGLTVGFLPHAAPERANPWVDLAFATGLGTVRNLLTARCCQSIVMVGGGVGTLNEVTIAYDSGVPVVVLEGSGGWADRLRAALVDGQWLDDRQNVAVSFATTAAEAVTVALERATEPRVGSRLSGFTGAAGH